MGLPEELWGAMHGVAVAARREKHPGILQNLRKIANRSLEGWHAASTTQFAGLACNMIPEVCLCQSLWKPCIQRGLSIDGGSCRTAL